MKEVPTPNHEALTRATLFLATEPDAAAAMRRLRTLLRDAMLQASTPQIPTLVAALKVVNDYLGD